MSITPIEVSSSWRGTPGKLVVKKGDLVDTIYDCYFGLTPEYILVKKLKLRTKQVITIGLKEKAT